MTFYYRWLLNKGDIYTMVVRDGHLSRFYYRIEEEDRRYFYLPIMGPRGAWIFTYIII
jgi:hypothetical protein